MHQDCEKEALATLNPSKKLRPPSYLNRLPIKALAQKTLNDRWQALTEWAFPSIMHGALLRQEQYPFYDGMEEEEQKAELAKWKQRAYEASVRWRDKQNEQPMPYSGQFSPVDEWVRLAGERLEKAFQLEAQSKLDEVLGEPKPNNGNNAIIGRPLILDALWTNPPLCLQASRDKELCFSKKTGEYRVLMALKKVYPEGLTINELAHRTKKDRLAEETPVKSISVWLGNLKREGVIRSEDSRPKKWFFLKISNA
jgi:hypothetical protein